MHPNFHQTTQTYSPFYRIAESIYEYLATGHIELAETFILFHDVDKLANANPENPIPIYTIHTLQKYYDIFTFFKYVEKDTYTHITEGCRPICQRLYGIPNIDDIVVEDLLQKVAEGIRHQYIETAGTTRSEY